MIVRKPYLRATDIMQKRVLENEKIEVLFEYNTLRLTGEGKVQGADLIYKMGEQDEAQRHIEIDGFFLAIGHRPNTDVFKDSLARDAEGYILSDGYTTRCFSVADCKNAVPGVFAAGDCADPRYRQAVVAAGNGCKAAMEADKYLQLL